MELIRLAGDRCEDPGVCPAIDLTDRATVIFTGPTVHDGALRVGPGEQAVELSLDLVKGALRALDSR